MDCLPYSLSPMGMRMRKLKNPAASYWAPTKKRESDNTQVVYDGDFLSGLTWGFVMLAVLVIVSSMTGAGTTLSKRYLEKHKLDSYSTSD
jgi:hypothetical protein